MTQEPEFQSADDKSIFSRDAEDAKKSLLERLKIAVTKPVTMMIAAAVFFLTLAVEYGFSRVLDALWEVEPPEEIVRLNNELQSSTGRLRQTSEELQGLVSRINTAAIEDPQLRQQLEQLNERLSGLNEMVQNTTTNTERVATFSRALQDDFVRLKSRSDGAIDSAPDLILGGGEAVLLCNGLTGFGVSQMQSGRVWYNLADTRSDAAAGSRIAIGEDAYLDFLGVRDSRALFKVHCSGTG